MRTLVSRLTWLALLLAACSGTTSPTSINGDPAAPAELRDRAGRVQAVRDYGAPGLELYEWTGPACGDDCDPPHALLGIDEATRAVVEGVPLFQRVRAHVEDPTSLATLALGALPVRGTELARFPRDARWAQDADRALLTLEEPAVHDGVLVFWGLAGSMAPDLVLWRVTLASGQVTRTPAAEVAAAARRATPPPTE